MAADTNASRERDHYQRLKEIYLRVRRLAESERDREIDELCSGATDLADAVRELLSQETMRTTLGGTLMQDGPDEVELPDRLGSYEIVGLLGQGGMGVVLEAIDPRLSRPVAIKLLAPHLVASSEARERLVHEARALAALNHPNIATIHGFETHDDHSFFVMERLEGPSIAERLSSGPMDRKTVLELGIQICDALDYAHRRGFVHRDLKPANVCVTLDLDGQQVAKVLDFGIAKPLTNADGGDASPGVIAGTASYMSPEQARGEDVDARTDVWALGCLLFELLSGERAFRGSSTHSTIKAVLNDEPNWDALDGQPPELVDRVIKGCLRRDLRSRRQSIADVRLDLERAMQAQETNADSPATDERTAGRGRFRWGLAGAAIGLVLSIALGALRSGDSSELEARAPLVQAAINSPPGVQLLEGPGPALALSNDGKALVFAAYEGNRDRLYLRDMASAEVRPLEGTDDARSPFFSPDGQWVGFVANGELLKVAVGGSAPVPMLRLPGSPSGATWLERELIVFAIRGGSSGLMEVPSSGGDVRELTRLEPGETDHLWPEICPGDRVLFYTSWSGSLDSAMVVAMSLETDELLTLTHGTQPKIADDGRLLFARRDSVWSMPFDCDRFEIMGDESPVITPVGVMGVGAAHYDVAAGGMLVYSAHRVGFRLNVTRFERDGVSTVLSWLPNVGSMRSLELMASGTQLLMATGDPGAPELWQYDVRRQNGIRVDEGAYSGVASPDGRSIAYAKSVGSNQDDLWWRSATGSEEAKPLHENAFHKAPTGWSPDGEILIFQETRPDTGVDLWTLRVDNQVAEPLLKTRYDEKSGTISPDGSWYAYTSDESGSEEIYVRPFATTGARHPVSIGGGRYPRWSPDGRAIFYLGQEDLMASDVDTTNGFDAGRPRALFPVATQQSIAGLAPSVYAVCPRAECFYVVTRDTSWSPPLRIVHGWSGGVTISSPGGTATGN